MNVQSLECHSVTCWIELKRILGSGLEPDQRTWPQEVGDHEISDFGEC